MINPGRVKHWGNLLMFPQCGHTIIILRDHTPDLQFRYICHIRDLGLERILAIGSDFDGTPHMDENLRKLYHVINLREYLRLKGLPGKLLDEIFYLNAKNFFDKLTLCDNIK